MLLSQANQAAGAAPKPGGGAFAWILSQAAPLLMRRAAGRVLVWVWKSDPELLVAAQPTRGVDIGAIEFIHRRIVEERDAGKAVLLVSLEMQEVLGLADRIVVIFEGSIVAEFDAEDVDEQRLGMAMIGSGDQVSPATGEVAP